MTDPELNQERKCSPGLTLYKIQQAYESLINFNIILCKEDAKKLKVEHGQVVNGYRFWISSHHEKGEIWKFKNDFHKFECNIKPFKLDVCQVDTRE